MSKRQAIPIAIVREAVVYDASTGKLFWKRRPAHHFATERAGKAFNSAWAGKEAFACDDGIGYRQGRLNTVALRAHVVAFALMTGKWPSGEIDHINGKRHDNRWSNLREVTRALNTKNAAMYSTNTSGFTGVIWHSNCQKWGARLGKVHLGLFASKEDAIAARKAAQDGNGYTDRHGLAVNGKG